MAANGRRLRRRRQEVEPAAAPVTLYAAVAGSIVVERLEKRYGQRRALQDVAFSVGAGEVVGLLGPNGAGKSTTLSILACALRADAGTVEIAGHPVPAEARAARGALGYVPQREALYPPLTARENLRFFGRMAGLGPLLRSRRRRSARCRSWRSTVAPTSRLPLSPWACVGGSTSPAASSIDPTSCCSTNRRSASIHNRESVSSTPSLSSSPMGPRFSTAHTTWRRRSGCAGA